MPLEIPFEATRAVREALAALGRTEDVRLSPSGRRLALAGFANGRIAVADVELSRDGSEPAVAVTAVAVTESPAFRDPHGLDFVDEETLVVGNRGGGIAVLRLAPGNGAAELLATTDSVRDDPASLLDAPGSVAVRANGPGREILACNNSGHSVTRHTLDESGRLVDGEVVVRRWLEIPDGLALSHDGRWLAVSNHETHGVLLYETASLGEDVDPVGILRGVNYPHGVRFTADDRFLVVADAGAPFVHVFAVRDGGWAGVGYPAASLEVMDEAAFARGRHNPQEGGPKGIDLDPRTNVLVATAENLPLAFFDLAPALDGRLAPAQDALLRYELDALEEAAARKAEWDGHAANMQAEIEWRASVSAQLEEKAQWLESEWAQAQRAADDVLAQLHHVHGSLSWRVTAPLRRAAAVARRVRHR